MYALPAFRVDDTSDLAAFIEARRFATLIVSGESGPQAAHIPMIINRDATGAPVVLRLAVHDGAAVTTL